MGPARPTTARRSGAGLMLSLTFHAGLVAATYMTWNRIVDVTEQSHAVPVELVTIAEQTNIAAQAPPEPEKIDIPEPPPVEAPPLPQFEAVEPAPVPPVPKVAIKPEPKPSNQDFAALLNKLTAPDKPVKNTPAATRRVEGIGAANRMTADIADALQSQIHECWSPPVGAPNPDDLVVYFDLSLNRDGTIAALRPTMQTSVAAASNPYTRAARDAAERAIYQCQHAGYRLPPDRYNQWNQVSLRLDPREWLNR